MARWLLDTDDWLVDVTVEDRRPPRRRKRWRRWVNWLVTALISAAATATAVLHWWPMG